MSDGTVRLKIEGALACILIDRPQAQNALTRAMLGELTQLLEDCSAQESLRLVVIRGAGDLAFSAGYNLEELPSGELTAAQARALHEPVRRAAQAIVECRHPVLAAAQKFVIGAALDLYCHCDLRLCEQGTKFSMPPNRYGFLYPSEGMRQMAQVATTSLTHEMLYTGQSISAQRALAHGLVNRVVDTEQFDQELGELCEALQANAPLSMRATKRALRDLAQTAASDEGAYQSIADCLNSQDVREALSAFREKRRPVFRGI